METFDLFGRDQLSESTCSVDGSPVSQRATQESDWVEKITVGSGLNIAGLSKNYGQLGCLEKILLGSSVWNSTTCLPIWRTWATPGGRLIFQLVPLGRTTNGDGSGLLPAPCAADGKDEASGDLYAAINQVGRQRGKPRLRYWTPDANCWKGGNRGNQINQQIRGPLNPTWVEWLMGFPLGWTALDVSATPSSRKSRKSSGEQ